MKDKENWCVAVHGVTKIKTNIFYITGGKNITVCGDGLRQEKPQAWVVCLAISPCQFGLLQQKYHRQSGSNKTFISHGFRG